MKLLFASLFACLTLAGGAGCQHTREAYREAEDPGEYAFVLMEHYNALLKEAVVLKNAPGTPAEAVAWMRQVEFKATPAVKKLAELRQAWIDLQSAETEAQLQAATDAAALLIADMVRAVRDARGGSASVLDERILLHAHHLEAAA
jgi:hypothetical protein